MLPLHGCLTIEALQQLRYLTIVVGNLPDGDIHQFPRVFVHDDHLPKAYGRRLESDLQFLTVLDLHTFGLIAQM